MKPTVIQSGSGGNPANNPGGSGSPNTSTGQTPPGSFENSRQFPNFQQPFGFPETEADDIFPDVRSRFGRLRDPFGFAARKRCGNTSNEDPYERYFRDDTDFFPNFNHAWDPMRNRRRVASQRSADHEDSDFFSAIPSEFRQYLPDSFGFGRQMPKTTDPYQGPPQQTPHPQQYYEAHSPGHDAPPEGQRPQYCDASIQTEAHSDPNQTEGGTNSNHNRTNLKQHGLRNTIDLGQKSEPERCRSPRAQSAPPTEAHEQAFIASRQAPQGTHAGASAQATSHQSTGQPSQTSQPTSAPYNIPRTQATQANHPQNTPPRPQPPAPQQQPQPQQAAGNSSDDGYVRHIPIFIEGRSEPIINKSKIPPPQQQPPQQQQQPQQQPQQYAYAQSPPKQRPSHTPPPQRPAQQEQQPQAQQSHPQQPERRATPPQRPTPLNTEHVAPDQQPIPQTPHTTESINKIQDIQKDVLDLMYKVEHFAGRKNDKEYMYLDEMLTRNLLKLDTIDTNGKDSIRLARKEAIKCIQASINVLEAKAEQNARMANATLMKDNVTENEKLPKAEEKAKSVEGATSSEKAQNEGQETKESNTQSEVCMIAVPVMNKESTALESPNQTPTDVPSQPTDDTTAQERTVSNTKTPVETEVTSNSSTKPSNVLEDNQDKKEIVNSNVTVSTPDDGPPTIEIVPKGSPNVKITIKVKKGKKPKDKAEDNSTGKLTPITSPEAVSTTEETKTAKVDDGSTETSKPSKQ